MEDKVKEKYMKTLSTILNNIIDFQEIDQMANNKDLILTPTKEVNKNLGSEYMICRNFLNVKVLSEEDQEKLMRTEEVDKDSLEVVFRTLPNVLMLDNKETITYDYTVLDRIVPNGYLVLEFVYCFEKKGFSNEKEAKAIELQDKMIAQLKETIEKEVTRVLKIPCRMLSNLHFDNVGE